MPRFIYLKSHDLVAQSIRALEDLFQSSILAVVKDFSFDSRYPHILYRTCSPEGFVRV